MKKYKSDFPGLGFYVEGEFKRFVNGEYATDSKEEIAVLDKLPDVKTVEEAKPKTSKATAATTAD